MKKSLQYILAVGPQNLNNTTASFKWYRDQVRNLTVSLKEAQSVGKSAQILPGGMYLFGYDPKTKETLPYYDTQPLILCFNIAADRFWGLNLHYLHPAERALILKELLEVSKSAFHTTHKMKLSWALLARYARGSSMRRSVKQYLFEHVVVRPVRINADAWKMSIYLPTEAFVGEHRTKIWRS